MLAPRILIVDEDEAVLDGLGRGLRSVAPEWRIDVARTGEEALAVLTSGIVDAVVSDLRSPAMGGVDLQRDILLRFPWMIHLKLTGIVDDEALVRATPWSERYLTKPCSPHDLRRELTQALLARENDRALVPRGTAGDPPRSPTVLCIDDNIGDAELFAQALIDAGTGVCMAHVVSGALALEALQAPARPGVARPDVVLLDLSMPGMDGLEFLARYRAGSDDLVPIIVVTGSTDPETHRQAVHHGAAIALIKPETWDRYLELARVISRFAELVARRGHPRPLSGRA